MVSIFNHNDTFNTFFKILAQSLITPMVALHLKKKKLHLVSYEKYALLNSCFFLLENFKSRQRYIVREVNDNPVTELI